VLYATHFLVLLLLLLLGDFGLLNSTVYNSTTVPRRPDVASIEH